MLPTRNLKSGLTLGRRARELPLQEFQRGDEIGSLDSRIWQVYRGVVQLSRIQPDGREVISAWVTPNGVFGNVADSSVFYRAVALNEVYAKRYNNRDVVENPNLARQFLAQFSDRLIKSQRLLAIIAISGVEERLKQLLLMLKQEIGQVVDDGIRLQVRFTHQHLAEALNTTRVTITRIVGELQDQDLIYFDRDRHIVLKNF